MVNDALLQKIQEIPKFVGFPTTLLIDRSGKPRMLITENSEGTLGTLDDAIAVLLAEPSAGTAKTDKPEPTRPR